jgi:hypothetical protein
MEREALRDVPAWYVRLDEGSSGFRLAAYRHRLPLSAKLVCGQGRPGKSHPAHPRASTDPSARFN